MLKIKSEVIFLSETVNSDTKYFKVGYYSMGISSILAGALLVLNQIGYEIAGGIYILWPSMMILLGLETIISKIASSIGKNKQVLKPAWGILFICAILIGCSQVWLILMDLECIHW